MNKEALEIIESANMELLDSEVEYLYKNLKITTELRLDAIRILRQAYPNESFTGEDLETFMHMSLNKAFQANNALEAQVEKWGGSIVIQ